jgi:hypothetical protein
VYFRVSWRVPGVGAKAERYETAGAALEAAVSYQNDNRATVRITAPDGREYEGRAITIRFPQDWNIGKSG